MDASYMKYELPPGRYYVGDPCYVFNKDWSAFLDSLYEGNGYSLWNLGLSVVFGTQYGDGVYYDQYGISYPVAAGLIGAVHENSIETLDKYHLTKLTDFSEPFVCVRDEGVLTFGHITIDTAGRNPDPDEDGEDDQYDC